MTERETAALIEEASASERDYGSNGRIRVLEDALRKQTAALTAAVTQRDAAERKLADLTVEPICLLSDYAAMRAERDTLTSALADATRALEALQVIASDECEWMTSPADRCPQAATPLANYCHTCRARHALAEPHP